MAATMFPGSRLPMRHIVGANAIDLYCCRKPDENDAIGYPNVCSKRALWKWMLLLVQHKKSAKVKESKSSPPSDSEIFNEVGDVASRESR